MGGGPRGYGFADEAADCAGEEGDEEGVGEEEGPSEPFWRSFLGWRGFVFSEEGGGPWYLVGRY